MWVTQLLKAKRGGQTTYTRRKLRSGRPLEIRESKRESQNEDGERESRSVEESNNRDGWKSPEPFPDRWPTSH